MRNITEDQCNSTEEVCGLFRTIFTNQEQMEAKIVQNAQEIEALRPKKGKSKMKSKGSALTRTLVSITLISVIAGLCFAAYVPSDINSEIAANHDMLAVYLRDVTNNMRSNTYVFTPRATAPALPVEGMVYYRDGTDTWIGYTPGGWVTFDLAGGNTLVGAYNSGGAGVGRTIDATDGAVVISNAEGDANPLLELTYSGGAFDAHGLIVTTNATGAAIEIENTGTGADLEGTAGWTISRTGEIIGLDLDLTGGNGITLENNETITNADGSIVFTDTTGGNTLIFDLDDGANSILIDSGDVVTLDWGTVDNFISMETITFDDAATSAIQMTGTGTNNLLITQLGVGDESLVLNSDGTPDDAIRIIATTGGIDIDAPLSIVITSTENQPDAIVIQATLGGIDIRTDSAGAGDDIDITATLGSIDLLATEDAANAITLTANGGVSETIVITSTQGTGADAITIVGTAGGIDIDAVDDIIITVASSAAADDLALVQTGGVNASITLAAAGTGADAIDLNASAGGIDIDAAAAITIDNAAGDMSFISAAGSVVITAGEAVEDAIVITSGGGIDIDLVDNFDLVLVTDGVDENLSITLTGGTASSIIIASSGTGTDAIDIDTSAGGIEINIGGTATAGDDFAVTTSTSITFVTTEAVANQFFMDAQGAVAGDAINLGTTDGGILLDAAGVAGGDITLNAVDVIILTSADTDGGGIDIGTTAGAASTIHVHNEAGTAVDSIEILTDAGGVTITSNLASDDGININAVTGGVDIDAALQINITSSETAADAIVIDASDGGGGIDIDAGTAGIDVLATSGSLNFHTTGAAGDRIDVINTTGTGVSLAEAETAAIQLYADAGGIGLNSGINGANAIRIEADGGVSEIIMIHSNQGTGASAATEVDASIVLLSDVGGIGLQSGLDGADAIRLETRGGGSAILILHSNDGTGASATGENDAAIQLLTDVGGISLKSGLNNVDSIRIETNGGTAEILTIMAASSTQNGGIVIDCVAGGIDIDAAKVINIQGDLAAASAIVINASAGGLNIDANGDDMNITLTADAANEDITIKQDGAQDAHIIIDSVGTSIDSIYLHEHSAGTAAGIKIHADAGNTEASIHLLSDVGGIDMDAASDKDIAINAGQILIESESNVTSAISLITATGTAETIVIDNQTGTTATSIEIKSNAGGITLAPGKLVTLGGGTVHSGIQDVPAGGSTTELVLTNTVFTVGADGGGDIMTLANGTAGQIVYIICEDGTGTTTITPATFNGGTSITFDAVGDTITLVYTTDLGWSIVGGNSYTII